MKEYATSAIATKLKMKLIFCRLPAYSQVRGIFFSKIESKLPLLRLLPRETLLSHLMNSTDYFVNIKLISFISACFELRDNLVTMITTSNSLNEQLLLVIVSYIIYNFFFLCYVMLFSTLLIILVNEIICN